jgi:hypothetical protein
MSLPLLSEDPLCASDATERYIPDVRGETIIRRHICVVPGHFFRRAFRDKLRRTPAGIFPAKRERYFSEDTL